MSEDKGATKKVMDAVFFRKKGVKGRNKTKKKKKDVIHLDGIDTNESIFEDNNFDEKIYARKLFEENTKENVEEFLSKHLTDLHDKASKKLQDSVHRNYHTFISTSKEISNLEVDMLELRNNLSEVSNTLKELQNTSFNFNRPLTKGKIRLSHENSDFVKDIHWILELPDELDILTSERLFDVAIDQIERANKLKELDHLKLAFESIKDVFSLNIQKLSRILVKDLQNPALKKTESRTIISYLSRLGFSRTAREIFLETRSKKIEYEIRKLGYENDVGLFINELARVIFTAIDSTCDDFQHSFKDNAMMSGFIVWTIKEMGRFLSHFSRKVLITSEVNNEALTKKCFEIAQAHCKTLEERGLALTFYLRESFKSYNIEIS